MARKKRIVITFASVPFVRGGAELLAENLHREILRRGFDCELVALPFKWYPREQILRHAFSWRLLDLTESNGEKIDLVIATKFPSYWVKHPNKVTWLVHQFRQVYDLYGTPYSDFNMTIPSDRQIMKEIKSTDTMTLQESQRIFSIARNVSQRLEAFNHVPSTPLYHPPQMAGRYYQGETGNYILSVGRLDGIKRIDLLINSFQYVKGDLQCIIAGTGPEEANLRKLIRQLDLEARVKLVGYVSEQELLDLYANCRAVYYAPFDEDYGYVTLEAFLSCKPVVTTHDSGGVLEFVTHDENGLVTTGEAQALAEALELLYSRPGLAGEMGKRGFEKVRHISWDDVIDRLTETL